MIAVIPSERARVIIFSLVLYLVNDVYGKLWAVKKKEGVNVLIYGFAYVSAKLLLADSSNYTDQFRVESSAVMTMGSN